METKCAWLYRVHKIRKEVKRNEWHGPVCSHQRVLFEEMLLLRYLHAVVYADIDIAEAQQLHDCVGDAQFGHTFAFA